ncbi:MAG TPA: hypothetical protein PLN69_07300 [bacterium]|nr:hypothetical protein [bacterium]
MTLTPEEQEIMAWGAEAIKAPWVDMTNVWSRLNSGEELSSDEVKVDPYFLPFDVNAKILSKIMSAGGKKAILGDNGSMLSIITNTAGDEIIWAALEREENGVYVEFHPLKEKLGQDWDKKGVDYLFNDDMQGAFDHFSDWISSQDEYNHIELGILKVANVQFFGAFKRAYEESDDGSRIILMGIKMAEAVNEILEEGWIRFCPDINLKKLLQTIAPALNILSPVNSALQSALEKLPL